MSRIAVPVVSEPVPAVVGTAIKGRKALAIGRPFPIGALMKSNKSASLYTENLQGISRERDGTDRNPTYKLAALAVSITLPPPTLSWSRLLFGEAMVGELTLGSGKSHVRVPKQ